MNPANSNFQQPENDLNVSKELFSILYTKAVTKGDIIKASILELRLNMAIAEALVGAILDEDNPEFKNMLDAEKTREITLKYIEWTKHVAAANATIDRLMNKFIKDNYDVFEKYVTKISKEQAIEDHKNN